METLTGAIAFCLMVVSVIYYTDYNDGSFHQPDSVRPTAVSSVSVKKTINKTLEDIFDIMKRQPIEFNLFDDMLAVAGENSLPSEPDGWKYQDSPPDGIKLVPDYTEDSTGESGSIVWQIGLKDGSVIEKSDCEMSKNQTIVCGSNSYKNYEWFSQRESS